MGKSTISMAIFNSYVKLPEGRCFSVVFFARVRKIKGIMARISGSQDPNPTQLDRNHGGLPPGKLTVCYGKMVENGHRNSGFTWIYPLIAWWFSIVFCMFYQRVMDFHQQKSAGICQLSVPHPPEWSGAPSESSPATSHASGRLGDLPEQLQNGGIDKTMSLEFP